MIDVKVRSISNATIVAKGAYEERLLAFEEWRKEL